MPYLEKAVVYEQKNIKKPFFVEAKKLIFVKRINQ